jgi:hypothetical protein
MITASTKYHGLNHIATGETFIHDICSTFINDAYLKEELEAEVYLYLAELPEDKFLTLFNSGQIKFYSYGMTKNQIRSKSSKFYRSHIRPQLIEDEFDTQHHLKYKCNQDKDEKMNIIAEAVDSLDFYRKELFTLYYYDNMSLMNISDFTASKNANLRIPKTSIWHAVNSAKKEVLEFITKNYPDMINEMERFNI